MTIDTAEQRMLETFRVRERVYTDLQYLKLRVEHLEKLPGGRRELSITQRIEYDTITELFSFIKAS